MHKDIETMIELQRYWDNVLRAKSEIERCGNSIKKWKSDVEKKKREHASLQAEIKDIKMKINQHEVDLSEKDSKKKKLEERRNILKSEKEVSALDRELEKLNTDSGELEEKLVELYDTLEAKEHKLKDMDEELSGLIAESEIEIKKYEERTVSFTGSGEENQKSFDGLIGELLPAVRSRFIKHIQSGSGKGIAPLEGQEICGACNFKIPSHLAQDASKNDRLVNCTNCGRFIYRDI